ncbi:MULTISPECIES: hypothetical protein [Microbacterium]|jgi:phosphotriesterase-related protein|uniref:phosphotriesterase family protein n=1 Tax=Microbacterium TaxID=33882 RepID=UPI001D178724|nr:hypothetical protein [Microbacterium testaceum]MCC4248674.1 hypothetical protein [Microbacterium testaceum]
MIQTVLGPVEPAQLGPTSTNEHLLADSRHLRRPLRDGEWWDGDVRPDNLGDLRWNWLASADNLHLDSTEAAVDELELAHADGLRAVVEATSIGMGPDPSRLPDISRRSGMHVIAAFGSYIDKTLPESWKQRSDDDMRGVFSRALSESIPGSTVRAGLLGLMGTSADITIAEERALRAAASAAAEAGCAVSIRLDAAARRGPEVAAILTSEGLDPRRILFCNIDKVLDATYVHDVVDTGAVVEFAFGSENYFADGARDATDGERLAFLLDLCEERPDARITMSTSVWTKGQLARNGGMGYGHVVRRIVPVLERAGMPSSRIERMLVTEPAELLDRG